MVRRVAVLALVAALAGTVPACGVAADVGDRRVALPDALPADVPLPDGAFLRAARDRGRWGLNLVFETGEPVAAVDGKLRSRLGAGGWSLVSEVTVESAVFSSYRKQGRTVALGVSRNGGITMVGLSFYPPGASGEGAPG